MIGKQQKDYTCGPAAVQFLLFAHGYSPASPASPASQNFLEIVLGTTEAEGTKPERIEAYFAQCGEPFEAKREWDLGLAPLPLLVNYFDGEDGHYAVIVAVNDTCLYLWDPADGRYVLSGRADFEKNWWSPRYGRGWGLCLR